MAKYDLSIREEELKNLVRDDWFGKYDGHKIIGNIDLSVCVPTDSLQLEIFDLDFFLWAEAKKGNKEDIDDSLVQLMITIMKARTYDEYLPPLYLGAFDAEKIAFIKYDDNLQRQVIFDQVLENKIDWTRITPSDHTSEEFQLVKSKAKNVLLGKMIFDFVREEKELRQFIKSNFIAAKTGTNKINITLNRMTSIFNRWLDEVKPTIKVDWKNWAKENILPADFFLADVISKNNQSLGESLQVLLRSNTYRVKVRTKFAGQYKDFFTNVDFKDNQKAHKTFWNKYSRPPRRKERLAMQERRDLLVEPDRRERKGAYFTPHQWVDLSREYLTNALGQNWQEEYYVWDCCAGTGNLLFGLTEKERIFASTLDEADVTYMKTQENLLPAHVFQFDFLNDDLKGDKVPEDLKRILKDPEERRKLVIYINPPYAEATTATTVTNNGQNKSGVSKNTLTYDTYKGLVGNAIKELYAQFIIRIYIKMPGVIIADFSTLKILQASNFAGFRSVFQAKLERLFLVPAKTFDNVTGSFPIGFFIWNTSLKNHIETTKADVYDSKGDFLYSKQIYCSVEKKKNINNWIDKYLVSKDSAICLLDTVGADFQHSKFVCLRNANFIITSHSKGVYITKENLIPNCIYLSARHCIEATWLNDRDQFYHPRHLWLNDQEFHSDCLAYTLFHGQNKITSAEGTNHWIPFYEKEVSAPMLFESHFMADFIAGRYKTENMQLEFDYAKKVSFIPSEPIQFSPEAQAVMDAGRELWKYYMTKKDEIYFNVNASYYDIRKFFQGEKNGTMNSKSDDTTYMRLWNNIKEAQKILAKKIEKKVYLYGFLLDETTLPEDETEAVEEQLPAKPTQKASAKKQKSAQQTIVNHYHINAQNISLQTEGTINIGEINDK